MLQNSHDAPSIRPSSGAVLLPQRVLVDERVDTEYRRRPGKEPIPGDHDQSRKEHSRGGEAVYESCSSIPKRKRCASRRVSSWFQVRGATRHEQKHVRTTAFKEPRPRQRVGHLEGGIPRVVLACLYDAHDGAVGESRARCFAQRAGKHSHMVSGHMLDGSKAPKA